VRAREEVAAEGVTAREEVAAEGVTAREEVAAAGSRQSGSTISTFLGWAEGAGTAHGAVDLRPLDGTREFTSSNSSAVHLDRRSSNVSALGRRCFKDDSVVPVLASELVTVESQR